jgi:hemoglobin-like flavoprotein
MPGFEQEGDRKMTLTPEQKQLVRSTWALVKPIQEDAARLFYGRLFEIDPSTKPLFASTDMAKQGKKLMQTINVAVAGLERLDAILPAVEALGRRHVGYGVREVHYESVGAALLWTLEQGLGEEFTPEVEEAWAETYWTLATVMKGAVAKAAA